VGSERGFDRDPDAGCDLGVEVQDVDAAQGMTPSGKARPRAVPNVSRSACQAAGLSSGGLEAEGGSDAAGDGHGVPRFQGTYRADPVTPFMAFAGLAMAFLAAGEFPAVDDRVPRGFAGRVHLDRLGQGRSMPRKPPFVQSEGEKACQAQAGAG